MSKQLKLIRIVLCIIGLVLINACSHKGVDNSSPEEKPSPALSMTPGLTPAEEEVRIEDVKVIPDPSYKDFFNDNPYSQLSGYMIKNYHPDRELYNYLFQAISNREETADISSFDLKPRQIMDTASTLYEQAGLQLFYFYRVKWSDDYKTIIFQYTEDTPQEIRTYQDSFYAQMNHLLYNVAPKEDTSLQKFFSVYDYITKYADYTDDLNDPTTFTAGSLLVNQKSICGGFSFIADYVLNFVGVPSVYISNVPHAWNIVTLMGNRYHSDFTWGAGSAGSNISFLRNALMNDETRMDGLNSMGYGDYKMIEGYPGEGAVEPEPCTDSGYDFMKDIYDGYVLDIPHNWIYYSDNDGIYRIHLDGTGKETLLQQFGYPIAVFRDVLYYVSGDQGLYQMNPGGDPILIDQQVNVNMNIEDGILNYSKGIDINHILEIDLNQYYPEDFDLDRSIPMGSYQMNKQQTFQLSIAFSRNMNTSKLPEDLIYVRDSEGHRIPVHMVWEEDGKTLSIRSTKYLNQLSSVSFYIKAGFEDANGNKTKESYVKVIEFTE